MGETGKLLEVAVIYPTPPQEKVEEAERKMNELIERYDADLIAIGNGTASRETELFVANLIQKWKGRRKIEYVIVSEAGASVYSASKLAQEEYPTWMSLNAALLIACRLQDPLAELVKIDPKAIGVGQYQHDVSQKRLSESLRAVVESAVNHVGVDLNTASAALLSYVSGINATIAENIVKYREQHGKFTSREQLKKVPRLGAKTFEQCAGFLRYHDGTQPLDRTPIHPESYEAVGRLFEYLQVPLQNIGTEQLKQKLNAHSVEQLAAAIGSVCRRWRISLTV